MNFTWESLSAAQNALTELRAVISNIQYPISNRTILSEEKLEKVDMYRRKFDDALENDLNMPQAVAIVWEVVKSNIPSTDKYDLLMDFDEVLGLGLRQTENGKRKKEEIPEEVQHLLQEREALRREKKFDEADEVRKAIEKKGYTVEDTPEGARISELP